MTITKPLFICSIIVSFAIGGLTGKMIISILIFGTLAGPCVWPSDYVMMTGESLEDLEWSVPLQCYLHPSRN